MAAERIQVAQQGQGSAPRMTTAEIIDRLSRFEGPPEQFLVNLLAVQCYLSAAEGGAILRINPDGRAEALAVYPPIEEGAEAPEWLGQTLEVAPEIAAAGPATTIRPIHGPHDLYGQPAQRHLVAVPLRGAAAGVRGFGAFLVQSRDPAALAASRERLELTISLLSLYEMRLTLQRRQLDIQRLRLAMEALAAVNENDRFAGAAMALCNEVASRWQAERVALGFHKGRYVQLKALSHTEKFSRKMKLVQDIEAAMEECFDQDVEVLFPGDAEATYVCRAAKELSERHGPTTVLSMPLRRKGQVVGVLTVERPADKPFGVEEIEALRLTCDLSTARALNLYEQDRWVGAKAAALLRKGLAGLVGPKHTWAKVIAAGVLALIVFLVFAKGQYTAEAPFVLEPVEKRVVVAQFDGRLDKVDVEPGTPVTEGQVLATLDKSELEWRLDRAQAERLGYVKQADAARAAAAEGDRRKEAEAQIALAQAQRVQAEIELLKLQIEQSFLRAPIAGTVVSGDLKRQEGAAVKTGTVLFEVAPLEALRAELSVGEDQIADVREGQEGELATASSPDRRFRFVVDRINPVAEVVKDRNVFKVRVTFDQGYPEGLRPGMEGVAKVEIDRRSYAWLWTRRLVNWVRMKLWL